MTRSEVTRTQRAASRPAHVRIGLRVLAVGGFAGAAWLLSAASAHAAEANQAAEDAPTDLSVVSLVNGSGSGADERSSVNLFQPEPRGGRGYGQSQGEVGKGSAVKPLVTGLASILTGEALLPADAAHDAIGGPAGPVHGTVRGVSAVVLPSATAASSIRIASAPATRPGGGAGPDANAGGDAASAATPNSASAQRQDGSGDGVILGVVRGLTTPLGLTGGLAGSTGLLTPLTRTVDPVVAPLGGILRPVAGVLLTAARPVTSTLASVTRTVTSLAGPPDQRTHIPTPDTAPVFGAVVTPATATGGPASTAGPRTVQFTEVGTDNISVDRHDAGAELRPAGTPDERSGGGKLPGRHYPAPLRAYLGAGAGIPASGPGSHSEGGAFATVPSSVVESTVAIHRLPVTTDVAVLRHEAQAPTVSPD